MNPPINATVRVFKDGLIRVSCNLCAEVAVFARGEDPYGAAFVYAFKHQNAVHREALR
jgi:hypothetical protein